MRSGLTALMVALVLAVGARAQIGAAPTAPLDPHDFALMAWGDSPSDPEQLFRMRKAGLNISGFCRPQDLDKVNAAGLACFVTDPRANDYTWEKMPEENTLKKNIASLAREVANKPAVLGFFLRDEPGVKLMPGLGRVAKLLTEAMPGTWPYVNLLPIYAMGGDLGASSYELYLRAALDDIHPPFLSYDDYSLVNGVMLDRFYQNLEAVRRVSLDSTTPFWSIVLSVAHFGYMEPSDATFRLQVYGSLAYGARGIEYFTYFTPQVGNYRLAPVDPFGHRTATWAMLRRINNQVRRLAPTLITLKSTGVYFSNPLPAGSAGISASTLVAAINAQSTHVPAQRVKVLIGEFEDPTGRPYFMLVNRDLDASIHFSIQLRKPYQHLIRISPFTGKEEAFGGEMDWLAPGAGILFRVE